MFGIMFSQRAGNAGRPQGAEARKRPHVQPVGVAGRQGRRGSTAGGCARSPPPPHFRATIFEVLTLTATPCV